MLRFVRLPSLFLLVFALTAAQQVNAVERAPSMRGLPNPDGNCKPFKTGNALGPFDYRDPFAKRTRLPIVEKHHWGRKVRALTYGESTNWAIRDVEYILDQFPNHHPGLLTMLRYTTEPAFSKKSQRYLMTPEGKKVKPFGPAPEEPVECYFKRAKIVAPNDSYVDYIWGMFTLRTKDKDKGAELLLKAVQADPSIYEAHYQLGLYYYRKGDLEKAALHGQKAWDLGWQAPGLRKKLKRKGIEIGPKKQ
ncbi:MAG: tetratricopeptide repeat protein [Gammaproteobacteria bacterium]